MQSTLSRLAIAGGMAAVLAVSSAPAATAAPAPSATKYSTYAYISASRKGSAVYINGLIKQNSASGIIRSPKRTVYVQRDLNGVWQNTVSRVADWYGSFTVGFISVPDYKYRLIVTASGGATGATSGIVATTTPKPPTPKPPTPPIVTFANCDAMHDVYPHGIGLPGAADSTSGTPVTDFYRNTALYNANTKSDRDNDGIACEKA
jgi:hypothetical protein